ncbi:MAG: endonuclease III domain-containing protein, partial [Planctomycetota bacterium]
GLSENGDPVKLEFDLAEIVPKKNWNLFSDLLIFHGRNICKARKPDCESCPILRFCPSANNPALW